jgi:hypothetical protein
MQTWFSCFLLFVSHDELSLVKPILEFFNLGGGGPVAVDCCDVELELVSPPSPGLHILTTTGALDLDLFLFSNENKDWHFSFTSELDII